MWVKMRYVVAKRNRDGSDRHYWQRPGFGTRRLPDDEAERIKLANHLNARADAEKTAQPVEPVWGSIEWAIDKYRHSEDWARLAAKTRKVYERWMLALTDTVGERPLESLSRRTVKETLDGIESKGGKHHCGAVLFAIAEIGVDYELLATNPAMRLKLPGSGRREAIWSAADEEAFLAACTDATHGEAMRLGFMIMLYTAQRPGDVRALQWAQYDGAELKFKQQKTGKFVPVPCHETLKAELDQAYAKRSGLNIVARPDGRAFTETGWREAFNPIRKAAQLDHLQARDIRRTAAVRLAEAGCTVPEIAAITGHSIERTQKILDVYVVRTRAMASAAIVKLERRK